MKTRITLNEATSPIWMTRLGSLQQGTITSTHPTGNALKSSKRSHGEEFQNEKWAVKHVSVEYRIVCIPCCTSSRDHFDVAQVTSTHNQTLPTGTADSTAPHRWWPRTDRLDSRTHATDGGERDRKKDMRVSSICVARSAPAGAFACGGGTVQRPWVGGWIAGIAVTYGMSKVQGGFKRPAPLWICLSVEDDIP